MSRTARSISSVCALPRSPLEVSVDRAVDLPRSQGPTTKRSGAYVEEENAASVAKTKRGALTSSGLRGSIDRIDCVRGFRLLERA